HSPRRAHAPPRRRLRWNSRGFVPRDARRRRCLLLVRKLSGIRRVLLDDLSLRAHGGGLTPAARPRCDARRAPVLGPVEPLARRSSPPRVCPLAGSYA